MIAAISILLTAQTVSFSHPVALLRDLVPALSKAVGIPLEVAPDEQWKVAYVKVKDVTTTELLDRIAEAVSSRWELNNEGVRVLKADPARAARVRADRQVQVTKSINEFLGRSAKAKDAESKILAQVVRSIGVSTIAALPDGSRIVYSSHPTRMQRQAPTISGDLISALVSDHNKEANKPPPDMGEEMDQYKELFPPEMLKMIEAFMEAERPRPITSPIAKLNFVITIERSLQSSIQGYDSTGRLLMDGGENRYAYEAVAAAESVERAVQGEKKEPESKPDARQIKFSKETADFIKGVSDYSMRMGTKAKLNPAREALLKINETDPFLKGDNEVLDQVLADDKRNIVIALGDTHMFWPEGMTYTDALELLQVDIEPGGVWLTRKLGDEEVSFDRNRLAAVLAKLNQPRQTLDDRAWLASEYDAIGQNSMRAMTAIQHFGGNIYGRNSDLLKLYGMLTKGQKANARLRGVAIKDLDPKQRAQAEKIVYGANHSAVVDFENKVDESAMFESMFDMDAMLKQQMAELDRQRSYMKEPTEALPNGLPSDGLILISEVTESAFQPVGAKDEGVMGMFGGESLTQSQLAAVLAMKDVPAFVGEMGAQMPKDFEQIKRKKLDLKLVCLPNYGAKEQLFEKTDDPAVKIDVKQMGPEFDKLLEKVKKSMKVFEKMMSMGGGFFNRGGNPPPR